MHFPCVCLVALLRPKKRGPRSIIQEGAEKEIGALCPKFDNGRMSLTESSIAEKFGVRRDTPLDGTTPTYGKAAEEAVEFLTF